MKRTTDEIMKDFLDLSAALSPENLHRDGEATKEEVKNSLANINKSWKNLETEIGYTVSEDEVWDYSRNKKAKAKLEQPVINNVPVTQKKKNFFGV